MENGESDSSSDDDSVLDETDKSESERTKRSLDAAQWCGVDPESASSTLDALHKYPQFWSNPNFGTKMQLYCATDYFIGVYPDGKVRGTRDRDDIHTNLELVNAGVGHVRIRGTETESYVAFRENGQLYSEADGSKQETMFVESVGLDGYNRYKSHMYEVLDWYVAINKRGKSRRGPKTKNGARATRFVPTRAKFN